MLNYQNWKTKRLTKQKKCWHSKSQNLCTEKKKLKRPENLSLIEVVVRPGAAVEGRTANGRRALDVPATIAASLARHGVVLDISGPCTGCDVRWFSHRVRSDIERHAVVASWEAVA